MSQSDQGVGPFGPGDTSRKPAGQAPARVEDPEATIVAPPPFSDPYDPEATIVVRPPGSDLDPDQDPGATRLDPGATRLDLYPGATRLDPEETIVAAPPGAAAAGSETTIFSPTDAPRGEPAPPPLDATIQMGTGSGEGDGSFSIDDGFDGLLPGQASLAGGQSVSAGGAASGVSWSASKSFWTSSLGVGKPGPEAGPAPAPGGGARRVVAGYEILGELGRGGMGVVYKAKQLGLNRVVALKMVLSGMHTGGEQLARFVIEAQAVAGLHHPNIVQIYEVGNEESGIPFFSLEFVPGGTLSEKLGGKPLADREAAALLEKIARAVHYAHENRIVHRDLKPGNILLAPDGTPKIADFGLAKRIDVESAEDGKATRSGAIMGSPSYMAPEQASGDLDRIGPGTDIYALGSMLFEMIAGRPPFLAARVLDILEQVRSQEPVPPSRLQPKVSADLETICLKCLQKDPARRYHSALDLADDLRRYLDGKPILARPVSALQRAWSWCRRNPRVASLLATILVLLTTLAAGATSAAVALSRQNAETEDARQAAVRGWNTADRNAQAAEDARQTAEANARVAQDQSNLAVQTLYQLARTIQVRIGKEGAQSALRQDLMQQALAGLSKVVETGSNASLVARTRIAAAQQMGDIAYDLGRAEEALQHYLKAREYSEALWSQDPDNEIAIWNRATLSRKVGEVNLELKGDTAAARAAFREAAEGRSRLTKMELKAYKANQGPKPEQVRSVLGQDYGKLGDVTLKSGDPAGAWSASQGIVEQLAGKAFATPAEYLAALKTGKLPPALRDANLLGPMAICSFHLGDRASASEMARLASEDAEQAIAKASPEDATNRRMVFAASLAIRGDLDVLAGKPKDALAFYDRAEAIHQAHAREAGESSRIQGDLSSDAFRKSTAHWLLGDREASLNEARRSLGYREALYKKEPGNNLRQGSLAFALARAGKPADAAKLLDPLKARAADDPGMLFLAAGGYALCSESDAAPAAARDAYRKAALATLEQAIRKGYRDKVALETDPDLNALRDDPAFRALLK